MPVQPRVPADADGNALISTSFNAGSGQTGSGVFNIHANREIGDAGSETVFAVKNRSTEVFRIGRNGVLGFTGILSASDGLGSFEIATLLNQLPSRG